MAPQTTTTRFRPLKRLAAVALTAAGLTLPLVQAVPRASAAVLPVGSSGGANLLFDDEFNGTSLNTANWRTCSWWADTTCSIESNHEQELYTPNNVSVANGVLTLQARRENAVAWNGKTYNYTSGMISSGGRSGSVAPGFTYKYGYAEARVRVPRGQGLWPAFWTLPSDYSWPPEIDAMEILGNQPATTYMHYHYTTSTGGSAGPGVGWTGPDFSADWHTFGVDWQPGAITFYVDGVVRWTFTDASAITSKPQYLLLNLAVGGDWPGSPDPSTPFPSNYLVDYVRVWDRYGTPGTATTTTVAPATTTTTVPTASPSTVTSNYANTVKGDGPVSYWRLGETSGTTAADSTGTNAGAYVNGVRQGAASLLASDVANPSTSYDGVNDQVSVPSSSNLNIAGPVSVEAWVRPNALPSSGNFNSLVTKAETYSLQFNGNRLEFTTMKSGTRRRVQAPAGAVIAGQTYHVVGTYDGTTQRLYVNGVQVASASFSGTLTTTTNRLYMGSWDGKSEFLNGTLDEVAVYSKVLTPTQIANHYNQGKATA